MSLWTWFCECVQKSWRLSTNLLENAKTQCSSDDVGGRIRLYERITFLEHRWRYNEHKNESSKKDEKKEHKKSNW